MPQIHLSAVVEIPVHLRCAEERCVIYSGALVPWQRQLGQMSEIFYKRKTICGDGAACYMEPLSMEIFWCVNFIRASLGAEPPAHSQICGSQWVACVNHRACAGVGWVNVIHGLDYSSSRATGTPALYGPCHLPS